MKIKCCSVIDIEGQTVEITCISASEMDIEAKSVKIKCISASEIDIEV